VKIFHQYATDVLSSLPPNATILTNDDMNCNTLHYLVRCENARPDVNVLKIPLITYDWWKPMQLEHFPNVADSFPGTRHHPFDKNGFSMRQFLDVNVPRTDKYVHRGGGEGGGGGRPDLFVLGDWKSGDDSQDVYERVPVGLADLVRVPGEQVDLFAYAKMAKQMATSLDMDANIEEKEGSWELVVGLKYQAYYIRASQ
jgi:hypothetical protein